MTLTRVHDHAAAGWRSNACYRKGQNTCRNETKSAKWLKRQVNKAARRAAKADIAMRLGDAGGER